MMNPNSSGKPRAIQPACVLLWILATQTIVAQAINGTVRYQSCDGSPAADVLVELFVDRRLVEKTHTDINGNYSFTGVPDGELELVHSRPGWAAVTVKGGNYVYPASYSVGAVLYRVVGYGESFDVASRLVLTFVDAKSKEPLEHKRIRLEGWGEFETDRLGRFTFFAFPYGKQTLEFHADGYRDRLMREDVVNIYHRLLVALQPEP